MEKVNTPLYTIEAEPIAKVEGKSKKNKINLFVIFFKKF